MNHMQKISRDIETRRLKLQMGLDPALEIDHDTVRHMWRELSYEQLKRSLRQQLRSCEFETSDFGVLPGFTG